MTNHLQEISETEISAPRNFRTVRTAMEQLEHESGSVGCSVERKVPMPPEEISGADDTDARVTGRVVVK